MVKATMGNLAVFAFFLFAFWMIFDRRPCKGKNVRLQEGFQQAPEEIQDFLNLTSSEPAKALATLPEGKVMLLFKNGTRVIADTRRVQSLLINRYRSDRRDRTLVNAETNLAFALESLTKDQTLSEGVHF